MSENNGFDLSDLVPVSPAAPASSPVGSQLPAELRPIQERDVLTQSNPKALINMLPDDARKMILEVIYKKENEDLFAAFINGEETVLSNTLKPSRVDNTLRYCLWTEHAFAVERGEPRINCSRVYAPVCSKQTWHTIIKSRRVFWILTPPVDIMAMNRMAYQKGIEKLYDILDLPVTDKDGKVNASLANLQMKIFALLDVRLNGPITHKHEISQTNRNVHIGVSADQVKKLFEQAQKEAIKEVPNIDSGFEPQDVIDVEAVHNPSKRNS
jgi:hypothetical protein